MNNPESSRQLPVALRRLAGSLSRLPQQSATPPGVNPAAVLVPLVTSDRGLEVILTKRTETVETHKGQIAFPGGMADSGDEGPIQTALRETEEEIGVPAAQIKILGQLEAFITPSDFAITPVVGFLSDIPDFHPNLSEVAEIFLVPLEFFSRQGEGRMEVRMVRGEPREVWFYEWGGHLIWGATARVLRDLLAVMDEHDPNPG
jgi:8-oxo-dGTP pyrophosphatase MutT (NUDIX family)